MDKDARLPRSDLESRRRVRGGESRVQALLRRSHGKADRLDAGPGGRALSPHGHLPRRGGEALRGMRLQLPAGSYDACRYCGWSPWPESVGLVGLENDHMLAQTLGGVRWWACGLCAWQRVVLGDRWPAGCGADAGD